MSDSIKDNEVKEKEVKESKEKESKEKETKEKAPKSNQDFEEKSQEPSDNRKQQALISVYSDSQISEINDVQISVDPEEAKFPAAGGGKSDHMIVNYTKNRLILKAKCNNNIAYRVDPVYQVVEPMKCKNLRITRLPGSSLNTKPERVLIEYAETEDADVDPKTFYKVHEYSVNAPINQHFSQKNASNKFPYLKIALTVMKETASGTKEMASKVYF
ncbi:unnamed protein product [Caenorhabditis bovis]|uniref:Major sperm protein n=1 Tax=Caenorhabditis bovis TaxID=2654633 RepID=A0A8S1F2Z0_9PELO|nr:unnamed protein product [Caenorhabditis bovis]